MAQPLKKHREWPEASPGAATSPPRNVGEAYLEVGAINANTVRLLQQSTPLAVATFTPPDVTAFFAWNVVTDVHLMTTAGSAMVISASSQVTGESELLGVYRKLEQDRRAAVLEFASDQLFRQEHEQMLMESLPAAFEALADFWGVDESKDDL